MTLLSKPWPPHDAASVSCEPESPTTSSGPPRCSLAGRPSDLRITAFDSITIRLGPPRNRAMAQHDVS